MYKLCFHVPEAHLELVKNAIFEAGAGAIGNYRNCSWQILGEGQFMPLAGSRAFIGEIDQLEKIAEYKVETVCSGKCISEVITALKGAHPYETPSYEVWQLENI